MTVITDKIATMRRIVDAANGRDFTKAQAGDFRDSREALDLVTDTFDAPAVKALGAAIKAVDGLPGIVNAFEGWDRTHGRKSAGRAIAPENPSGSTFASPGIAYGTKAIDWGRDFTQIFTRSCGGLGTRSAECCHSGGASAVEPR